MTTIETRGLTTIVVRLSDARYDGPWDVEVPSIDIATLGGDPSARAARRAYWTLVHAGHLDLEHPVTIAASLDDGATWANVPGPWDTAHD